MADKEKPKAPESVQEGTKKPETKKPAEKIKTSLELKEEKGKLFESKKQDVKKAQTELLEKKKAIKDIGIDVDAEYAENDGENKRAQEYFREGDLKKPVEQQEKAQKEALQALKAKHEIDIKATLENMDIDTLDTQNRGTIHIASLANHIKGIDNLPPKTKEEALKGLKGPDDKPIDVTKPLTPDQIELVQKHLAKDYIKALSNLSPADIKDPKKLADLEKLNPGITEFVAQEPAELLTEKSFLEKAKKDPEVMRGFIDSIEKDGMLVTGITADSKLGQALVKIIDSNVAEYLVVNKPEEGLVDVENFKSLKDILGGSYEDLIYSQNFLLWEDHPLKKSRDAVRTSFQDKSAQLEVPDMKNATPEKIQAYKKSLEQAFTESTGIDGKKAETAIKKISRNKLSPLVRFLADLFAPLGALMPWEVGDFWREYLQKSQEDLKSENSTNNANYEQYGKWSEGIDWLESGSILAAANKYVWVTETKDGNLIREMHKSWGLNAGPGTAWCMSFVQHVLRKDMKLSTEQIGIWPTASAAAGHRIWKHTDTPQLGDIVLVKSSAAASGRHIAFFAWFDGDRVKILGWNQGDAVSIKTYPKSSVAEYRTLQKGANTPKWTATWSTGEVKKGHDAFPDTPVGPENYPSKAFLAQNGKTPETVPMGMRVNNPLNIKFTWSAVQRDLFEWVVGKSVHTDQGDPQIAFSNPEAWMVSGLRLLLYKQKEHWLNTIQSIIADVPWGWTQGGGSGNPMGNNAAREIAQRAWLSLTGELNLSDPGVMKKFVQSLLFQEHWNAANIYSGILDSSIWKI